MCSMAAYLYMHATPLTTTTTMIRNKLCCDAMFASRLSCVAISGAQSIGNLTIEIIQLLEYKKKMFLIEVHHAFLVGRHQAAVLNLHETEAILSKE